MVSVGAVDYDNWTTSVAGQDQYAKGLIMEIHAQIFWVFATFAARHVSPNYSYVVRLWRELYHTRHTSSML